MGYNGVCSVLYDVSRMITFLTGNDHFRLRLRERALTTEFQSIHLGCEEHIFDGRDVTPGFISRFQEALSGGLFAAPRVILVRHVELFDEKLGATLIDLLGQMATEEVRIVASAELVGRPKKDNAVQTWLAQHAIVEEVPILTGQALAQSIIAILRDIDPQVKIESRAIESLAILTNGVTGHIYHDLLKLVLATSGRTITESVVRQLIGEPAGESVSFALLEALIRGNRERAIALLRQEETNDDAVFKLLGLFAWQVRQALMVRDEYERGVTSPDSIAAAIGAKPFSVRKLMPLIPKLSLVRLKRSLAYLSDLDRSLKTGQIRPGVALDLFVWKF